LTISRNEVGAEDPAVILNALNQRHKVGVAEL
jgi:hypothetical protein